MKILMHNSDGKATYFRLHDCDCCRKSLAKKEVLDDQKDSYNVFSGKVKRAKSHCEI